MLLRGMLIGLCVAALSSCGDAAPKMMSSVAESPAVAGSCNFMANARCDDYAELQTTPDTGRACGDMGGEWANQQCPVEGRAAVCTAAAPATRTYAYTTDAANALAMSCPAGKFLQLEGACDMPAKKLCDEYIGSGVAGYGGAKSNPGEAANRCTMGGGTWTSGGRCAMQGRSASCASNAPATYTYAYDTASADQLGTKCMPSDFKRIGGTTTPPPPVKSDEDAGL